MTRLILRATTALAVLTAGFAASFALAGPASAATTVGNTSLENQVVSLINQQRNAAKCRALGTDANLRTAARNHSADMVNHNFFSHTSSDGTTFDVRVRQTGYTLGYGENIAWGQRTAAAVVTAWMNSAPHKSNILNCSFNRTGVGVAFKSDGTPYWTQDFGRI